MHALFFLCGFVAVGFVLLITVYLIISGLPAIREVGLKEFLFGPVWDSTNRTDPRFGILALMLTSVYGTAGAIVLGVPVGFMTAVFISKVAPKRLAALIRTAHARGIPIVSALGTGNKMDASRFELCDISQTSGCPFARVMRRELRSAGITHHAVVFSPEPAMTPEALCAPPPGRRSVPGSLPWVPASAGLLLAQKIVLDLCAAPEAHL